MRASVSSVGTLAPRNPDPHSRSSSGSQVKVVVICDIQPAAVLVSSCDCALIWHRDVLGVADPCTPTRSNPVAQHVKRRSSRHHEESALAARAHAVDLYAGTNGRMPSEQRVKKKLARKQAFQQAQKALNQAQKLARRARNVNSSAFVPDASFAFPDEWRLGEDGHMALHDLDL